MRFFSLVVAASSSNLGIGLNGKLPWKISQEMKYFKELTLKTSDDKKQNCVIMGRKTFESIPKKYRPLSNRLNIVLTRNKNSKEADEISKLDNTIVCDSLDNAMDCLNWKPYLDSIENIFIIGGSEIYNLALDETNIKYLSNIYLTKIYFNFKCDTFLNIDLNNFNSKSIYNGKKNKTDTNNGDSCDCEYEYFILEPKNNENENNTNGSEEKESSTKETNLDHEEYQYLNLCKEILDKGCKRSDRTGTGTLSLFGTKMEFDLSNNTFPLLTTKRVFYRGVVEELLWFIKGSTYSKLLSDKKVKIWDGNGSREFLDSRGLNKNEEGDLGPVYGFQWRHFGAKYLGYKENYENKGYDQLMTVIKTLKTNPFSRRIILSAWNPSDLNKMALPPCHMFCQFFVNDKKELSCQMYQRSADMGLGVPFNIASYSLLTIMIAKICNLKLDKFVHVMGDTHVYLNHIDPIKEQLKRKPKTFPKLYVNPNIKDIEKFCYNDFKLVGYKPQKSIKMKMAV